MLYSEEDIKRAVKAAQDFVTFNGVATIMLPPEEFYQKVLEFAKTLATNNIKV